MTMTRTDTTPHAEPWLLPAVLLLAASAFGSGLSQRIADPLLPVLAREFALSVGVASWAITSLTIGYALSQLLMGPMGDRFGKFRLVKWLSSASAVTALLCALAPNFYTLLSARVMAGVTVSGIVPLAMAWLGDVVPYEQRQPILARYLIGFQMGSSCGQLLGGLSADYFGWRFPFFIIAGVFVLCALGQQRLERNLPAQVTRPAIDQHLLAHLLQEFGHVLKRPWARVVLITVALEGGLVYGAYAFFATHLHHMLNISLTAAGSIAMLFGFGGLLFATTSSVIIRRLGLVRMAQVGGLIMLSMMVSIAFIHMAWLAMLACLIFGLGFYMLHNTLQTESTQMAPERRGAAVSSFSMCYFVGQSTGVAIAGVAMAHINTMQLIVCAAVGVLLTALYFAAAKQRHQ